MWRLIGVWRELSRDAVRGEEPHHKKWMALFLVDNNFSQVIS